METWVSRCPSAPILSIAGAIDLILWDILTSLGVPPVGIFVRESERRAPARFTASRTRAARLLTSPPFTRWLSSHRKYQRIAAPHCSSCQFSRVRDCTDSLQNTAQASRPGRSPLPQTNFSNHPSNIEYAGTSRNRTSLDASRSLDQAYKPDPISAFMSSNEHLFLRAVDINLLPTRKYNHGNLDVTETQSIHIESIRHSR